MPNNPYRPGKGAHLILTEEVSDWMSDIMYKVYEVTGSSSTNITSPEELRDAFPEEDWRYEKDAYGHKMITAMELDEGQELRVAVILTPKGELRLDIRTWFDPETSA